MPDELAQAQQRLNAARARRRRQQLGPPLAQDDAALDRLATVDEHDLGAVEAFMRDSAGQLGVDLLRARRVDGIDYQPFGSV